MAKKAIPDEIRQEVKEIIERFNETELNSDSEKQPARNPVLRILALFRGQSIDSRTYYSVRYRGQYMYFDRTSYGRTAKICRLKYNGEIDNWDFAIYKYSREKYDPDEWFFPGSQYANGTIEGAMRAGLAAYPN